jgi:hypothetical protein
MVNSNKGGNAVPRADGGATTDKTGAYALSTATGTTTYGKGTTLGVAVPMGAWTLGVQYANNSEQLIKATELFAQYALSKRTTLMAYNTTLSGTAAVGASSIATVATTTAGVAGTSNSLSPVQTGALQKDPSITAVGIRHTF